MFSSLRANRRLSFLFAPAAGAATLPPSADGESPLRFSGGDSPSADGGNVAAPAAGAKRKDNLRFARRLLNIVPALCAD